MTQPSLFDAPPAKLSDICRVKHGGNPESEAANTSVHAHKTRLRDLILDSLRNVGPATREELEQSLGMSTQTASARCAELLKDGEIRRTGQRRPTKSGRMAAVLEVVPH